MNNLKISSSLWGGLKNEAFQRKKAIRLERSTIRRETKYLASLLVAQQNRVHLVSRQKLECQFVLMYKLSRGLELPYGGLGIRLGDAIA